MPTYRKLHTKIIDSYDFAEMPNDFTRVFWMLLIVTVDSEGRALDNPSWLRSRMFPLRGDDVATSAIEGALTWLNSREMIVRYLVGGRKFFYIPKFKSYQSGTEREAKSVLPPPSNELMNNSRLAHEEVGSSANTNESATATEYESESVHAYVSGEKPNIYKIYEQEIGALTPMLADELDDAEKMYPPDWIEDALKQAALHNKRNWKYALAILRRRQAEGPGGYIPPNGKVNIILPNGETKEVNL